MARALWYEDRGRVALREMPSQDLTPACDARVRMLWSGISRGTERLILNGSVPESEHQRMRAPFQEGEFPFPVKYGYAAVGTVEEGPKEVSGREVFCLFPHQDSFAVSSHALTVLPDGVPARRATLAANAETALNAIWDSGVGAGDRVAIIGAGILGGLLALILGRIPGCEVSLVDVDPTRASLADDMDVMFREPEDSPTDCDVVFHTSSHENGAATALESAGFEGRIVELSWYGDKSVGLPLGGAFHAKRLTYKSSQVGSVAPSRRPRWDYARRIAKALDLLCDDRADLLITNEVAFDALPAMLPAILSAESSGLATVVRYP